MPIEDGLDPDAAAYLARLAATGAPAAGTPEQARAQHTAAAGALSGPGEPVERVDDGRVGGVRVRRIEPPGARGTTVYLHGGGWVVGTLDTFEPLCRSLALRSGSTVVMVDYDLAPERRHPTQVRQVVDVLAALAESEESAGPVALAGDSAGAHLAVLAATLVAQRVPSRRPAGLALVYPVVRPALDTASAVDNATGYGLTTQAMRWYWEQYLPAGARAAPGDPPVDLLEADLSVLPPTMVLTAGKDPLRDEGRALADAVERSGVAVRRLSYDGQVHGFFRMPAVVAQARQAQREVGGFLREVLG